MFRKESWDEWSTLDVANFCWIYSMFFRFKSQIARAALPSFLLPKHPMRKRLGFWYCWSHWKGCEWECYIICLSYYACWTSNAKQIHVNLCQFDLCILALLSGNCSSVQSLMCLPNEYYWDTNAINYTSICTIFKKHTIQTYVIQLCQ